MTAKLGQSEEINVRFKVTSLCATVAVWAHCVGSAWAFDYQLATPVLEEALRSASAAAPLAQEENPSSQDVLAAAGADYARLVGVLYDNGYFAPVVSIRVNGREAATIPPISPPAIITSVEIDVSPGQKFQFGRSSVTPLPDNSSAPGGFRKGQTASISVMRATVDAAISDWRAQGHAKAKLAGQEITARHAEQKLDVDIEIAPGPKLRFGQLQVTGNAAVGTSRVHDIAGLPENAIFDPETLSLVALRLRRSGAFGSVSLVEAEQANPDGTLDVIAQLGETKPRRFGFGAEVSTLEGLSLSAFWLHRNLFGGAERLRVAGEIEGLGGQTGGTDFTLDAEFTRPATFNEDTDFYLRSELQSLEEPSFTSDSFSIETGIRRYASLNREYTLGLGFERADTTDAFGRQTYSILTLPLSAKFDYRDDPLNAKTGYFAEATVTPFLNLTGTENGAQFTLDARGYHSLGAGDRVTLAVRGQLGVLTGPDLATAPSDFLFLSGGSGTVRGQDYQSLGVDLGSGNTIGGRSFVGLSGEVRVKTTEALSVVGFYDIGFIGDSPLPSSGSGDVQSGAGLGVRYDTSIGPIRFDVAVPVSGPGDQSGFEVYIGIGQAF